MDTEGGSFEAISVASDADGAFVTVWEENDPGGYSNVYARRYDAAGTALGNVFLVNTATDRVSLREPSVAMDDGGGFVVAWQRRNLLLDRQEVVARLYGADGNARGGEFVVAAATLQKRYARPAVAMGSGGDFVVTYSRVDEDPVTRLETGWLAGRPFRSDGTPAGAEFRGAADGELPNGPQEVAMEADGDFVVAWPVASAGVLKFAPAASSGPARRAATYSSSPPIPATRAWASRPTRRAISSSPGRPANPSRHAGTAPTACRGATPSRFLPQTRSGTTPRRGWTTRAISSSPGTISGRTRRCGA